jgi:hypothetical protein
MAPTRCPSDARNFLVLVNFGLVDMNYLNWAFQLWRLDDGATEWQFEEEVPGGEAMSEEIFCIESAPLNTRYLVQAVNLVDGR